MNAKELYTHVQRALTAFGLQTFEGELVNVRYCSEHYQLIFNYENMEYRVSL